MKQNPNQDLQDEFLRLTSEFDVRNLSGRGDLAVSQRRIEASLAPDERVYQCMVIAVGPECKEIEVGDLAILPPHKGTMITVLDEETGEPQRVYAVKESDVLARYIPD